LKGRLSSTKPYDHKTTEPAEQFVTAPGIAGMVMYVFTMPKLNMVFKIIRDKFAPPKQVTPRVVKEKYELVKRHDRVGRMADSYLFEKLALSYLLQKHGDIFDADFWNDLKARIQAGEIMDVFPYRTGYRFLR